MLTAMVVILILATMLISSFAHLQSRAEKASCINNLKNLYVAANGHIQDQRSWPQVKAPAKSAEYAIGWRRALEPYGIGNVNWVCPTIQRSMDSPDLAEPGNERVDYMATAFDANPMSPHKWPKHPWFIERGDVHGDGNLVLFANGNIKTLSDISHGR